MFFYSFLEKRVEDMEGQRQAELKSLQEEKEQLKSLVEKQTGIIEELKQQLQRASEDNTVLQQQQHELAETVNNLIQSINTPTREWAPEHRSQTSHRGILEEKTSGQIIIIQSYEQLYGEQMVQTASLGDLGHKIRG